MAVCRFVYSAKVLCGEARERGEPLAPGIYVTEVNVYNPNERPVRLMKRFALTVPPGDQQEGEVVLDEGHVLGPERALAIDCRYIREHAAPAPAGAYFIGFLVIESTDSVDVTAVYTTAGLQGAAAPAIAVEQIRERKKITEE
jgi:hypothetical protein